MKGIVFGLYCTQDIAQQPNKNNKQVCPRFWELHTHILKWFQWRHTAARISASPREDSLTFCNLEWAFLDNSVSASLHLACDDNEHGPHYYACAPRLMGILPKRQWTKSKPPWEREVSSSSSACFPFPAMCLVQTLATIQTEVGGGKGSTTTGSPAARWTTTMPGRSARRSLVVNWLRFWTRQPYFSCIPSFMQLVEVTLTLFGDDLTAR